MYVNYVRAPYRGAATARLKIAFMLLNHRFTVVALCSSLLISSAHGAELGDPVIRSHIGQPLIADVELNMLSDPAGTVTVRMAHADVYKGANISANPVLGSINMAVMKRDGRQFLHITSTRPVGTENLHLFLDITDGGKRNVRAVTLWLTPDPTPAPVPVPVLASVPAPAPVAASVPVAMPMPMPTPTPVPKAVPRVLVSPAPMAAPVAPTLASAIARERPARTLTVPASTVASAICPQSPFSADQIKACEVSNEKNAVLSAQIVDLEAKVKRLQVAMEGKVAAPVPVAATKAVPPRPPKKVQPVESGFPWLLTVGLTALFAAIGAGVWFIKRRRKGRADPADPAVEPIYKRLLARLKRPRKIAPTAAPLPPDPNPVS